MSDANVNRKSIIRTRTVLLALTKERQVGSYVARGAGHFLVKCNVVMWKRDSKSQQILVNNFLFPMANTWHTGHKHSQKLPLLITYQW